VYSTWLLVNLQHKAERNTISGIQNFKPLLFAGIEANQYIADTQLCELNPASVESNHITMHNTMSSVI
jgi:hypothetical protein